MPREGIYCNQDKRGEGLMCQERILYLAFDCLAALDGSVTNNHSVIHEPLIMKLAN